jgi:hypothetical protein
MIGWTRRVSRLAALSLVAMLALASTARAGVNTWTGGSRPTPAPEPNAFLPDAVLVASDPRDPYVVYAVFQPHLYKSRDGGRTWTHLASYLHIGSLLVHPAAPDTVYMGVIDGDYDYVGVVNSADRGVTWVRRSPFQTTST